ncbi:MAG: hypothetical protein GWO78_00265 [Dehalococcoidales bacterium]|nr:hypothetical protein [Dehalococcoidales bacterium]
MKLNKFNLIAHRGFSEKSPENTFPSFDLAIKEGFHNFEFDVQLTKDKIPVVIHDDNLLRTTGILGIVAEKKYSEIKLLNAINSFTNLSGDYSIPRLDELLIKYKNKANLHLELKSRDQDLPEIVFNCLKKNKWLNSDKNMYEIGGITISSFYLEQIIRFKYFENNERTAWLLEKITRKDLSICKLNNIDLICPKASFADKNTVLEALNMNILVRNWGVLNEKDLLHAYKSGSTGTTIDWPKRGEKIISNI